MECGLHLINEGSQPGASRACTLTLTMTDCSEAEEEESIYSEEESGSEAADDFWQLMVGEVARGLSLFGGASSEVRRCNCSVVV